MVRVSIVLSVHHYLYISSSNFNNRGPDLLSENEPALLSEMLSGRSCVVCGCHWQCLKHAERVTGSLLQHFSCVLSAPLGEARQLCATSAEKDRIRAYIYCCLILFKGSALWHHLILKSHYKGYWTTGYSRLIMKQQRIVASYILTCKLNINSQTHKEIRMSHLL